MKRFEAIACNSKSREVINSAIQIPKELRSDDGFVFKIASWTPTVKMDEVLTIECVLLPGVEATDIEGNE